MKLTSPPLKMYGYLKKDFVLLYKRKKYLFLFIMLPLIISMLFLFALNPSQAEIEVGICDLDKTEASRESFSNLNGFDPVILSEVNCVENLLESIRSGEYALGIEIPLGFSANLNNLKQSRLIVYYDTTDISFSNLISWKVDSATKEFERGIIDQLNTEVNSKVSSVRENIEFASEFKGVSKTLDSKLEEADSDLEKLEEMNTEFLVNPIWTEHRSIYDSDLGKSAGIAFIFPVLALFIILMLASTSIIYDKKTNFITRVKASTSPSLYLFSKVVFFTCLVLVQFLIVLLLFLTYSSTYNFRLLEVLKFVIYIGIIDSLLGFIIGLISDNEGIAVLFSLIISFPLMLVSGIFFPIQTLPKFVQWIAQILPLNYQVSMAKSVLLFSGTASINWLYVSLGLFVFVWWLIKKKG